MRTIAVGPALLTIGCLALAAGACSRADATLEPEAGRPAAFVAVSPRGGATGVEELSSVTVQFDDHLMAGMEAYASLHEGDVTGPQAAGDWAMSQDRRTLTFTPASLLKANTPYTIHLGGGMMDANGDHADFEIHGGHMGGSWATQGMMVGGGMMGGAMGDAHMGEGWRHPDNGSYGMVFFFKTAS